MNLEMLVYMDFLSGKNNKISDKDSWLQLTRNRCDNTEMFSNRTKTERQTAERSFIKKIIMCWKLLIFKLETKESLDRELEFIKTIPKEN